MKTRVTRTAFPDLLIVNIDYFEDERGFFIESWHKRDFAEAGLAAEFVQDSHSRSVHRVVRGLHYQNMSAPMAKLIRCTVGRILDVAVDLRTTSPTFGKTFSLELSAANKTLLYVPIGFAHGFATLSEVCEVQYKQTDFYEPSAEGGIAWNDPDLGINWPFPDPLLSNRDQNQSSFRNYLKNPVFK
jgi:dTDP-4-dehydrorhamnose 3,5-epimerase